MREDIDIFSTAEFERKIRSDNDRLTLLLALPIDFL